MINLAAESARMKVQANSNQQQLAKGASLFCDAYCAAEIPKTYVI